MKKKEEKHNSCISQTGKIHAIWKLYPLGKITLCERKTYQENFGPHLYRKWASVAAHVTCERCAAILRREEAKKGYKNCISPTGCVHSIQHSGLDGINTLCNHRNYFQYGADSFYHKWRKTNKPVTCKRCLTIMYPDKDKSLAKIIEDTEQWQTFRKSCPVAVMGETKGRLCSQMCLPCNIDICGRLNIFLRNAKGLNKIK